MQAMRHMRYNFGPTKFNGSLQVPENLAIFTFSME
jgi:hypothetical protein